jgi:N-acetylneuraminic acid mutarotase
MISRTCFILAVLISLITFRSSLRGAEFSSAFTYQGRLTDAGQAATGLFDIYFVLWTAPAGGTALGSDDKDEVPVTNGLFTVELAFNSAWFDGNERWLEMRVRPAGSVQFITLQPRQRLSPAPHAVRALKANNADLAQIAVTVPDGAITASKLAPGAAASNVMASGASLLPSGAIVMSDSAADGSLLQSGLERVPGQFTSTSLWRNVPPGPPASGFLNSGRYGHGAAWNGTIMFVYGGAPLATGVRYHAGSNVWLSVNPTNAPETTTCKVFWTGSRFLVWDSYHRVGGRYNPTTDSWQLVTDANAPSARLNETAVWTGTELIVWGGGPAEGGPPLNTGRRYNPASDIWTTITTVGAPTARRGHAAAWTGTRMVVCGGYDFDEEFADGGQYNPTANTWTPVSAAAFPRYDHTAVWSGTYVIVWGGFSGTEYAVGERYNPLTDIWSPMAETSIYGRFEHTAIWTGNRMVVFGGLSGVKTTFPCPPFQNCTHIDPQHALGDGASYDPVGNGWTQLATGGEPGRAEHSAVWTGTQMLVWGGFETTTNIVNGQYGYHEVISRIELDAGRRYTTANNTWTNMAASSATGEPAERHSATAVWAGDSVIVWGGESGTTRLRTGGIFRPDTGWTALPVAGAPSARKDHTAVWTGTEMLIWGGYDLSPVNTGARFHVASNIWIPISTVGAPRARRRHSAVWTGTEMIVWGGFDMTNLFFPSFLSTGGRYNPITDTWTNLPNAPALMFGRAGHSAVWTGTEMILWGGYSHSGGLSPTFDYYGTGARYDPAANTWSSLPFSGAPAGRTGHSAVWARDSMIVFGGVDGNGEMIAGANYSRTSNSWTTISSNGAPAARSDHTAVWTGREMLVSGGIAAGTELSAGGVYDPALNQWTVLLTNNAPLARFLHSAVWSGGDMYILNGRRGSTEYGVGTNDNKVYSPQRTYYLYRKL